MYPEDNGNKAKSKSSSKLRRVVGLVVFDGEKFLLLHRKLNWVGWEFPKGHIDSGESIPSAIKRELFEETGLFKYEVIGKVDDVDYSDKVRGTKTFVQNFLLRVSSNNKISFENQSKHNGKVVVEHDDFKWCFPGEAVKMLKHDNMKETMKKAIKMLGLEIEK